MKPIELPTKNMEPLKGKEMFGEKPREDSAPVCVQSHVFTGNTQRNPERVQARLCKHPSVNWAIIWAAIDFVTSFFLQPPLNQKKYIFWESLLSKPNQLYILVHFLSTMAETRLWNIPTLRSYILTCPPPIPGSPCLHVHLPALLQTVSQRHQAASTQCVGHD